MLELMVTLSVIALSFCVATVIVALIAGAGFKTVGLLRSLNYVHK